MIINFVHYALFLLFVVSSPTSNTQANSHATDKTEPTYSENQAESDVQTTVNCNNVNTITTQGIPSGNHPPPRGMKTPLKSDLISPLTIGRSPRRKW